MFIPENVKVDVMNALFTSLQSRWENANHVKKQEFDEMMVMHSESVQSDSLGFDLQKWEGENVDVKEEAEDDLKLTPRLEVKSPRGVKLPSEEEHPKEPAVEEDTTKTAELPVLPSITLDTLSPQSIFSLFTNEEPRPAPTNPMLSQSPLSPRHQFNAPPAGNLPLFSFGDLLLSEADQPSPMNLQLPTFQESINATPYDMYNNPHSYDLYGRSDHVGIAPNPTSAMESDLRTMIGQYEETNYAGQPTLMELLQQSSIEKVEKMEKVPQKDKEPEEKETKTEEKKLQKATRKPTLLPRLMKGVKKSK